MVEILEDIYIYIYIARDLQRFWDLAVWDLVDIKDMLSYVRSQKKISCFKCTDGLFKIQLKITFILICEN